METPLIIGIACIAWKESVNETLNNFIFIFTLRLGMLFVVFSVFSRLHVKGSHYKYDQYFNQHLVPLVWRTEEAPPPPFKTQWGNTLVICWQSITYLSEYWWKLFITKKTNLMSCIYLHSSRLKRHCSFFDTMLVSHFL